MIALPPAVACEFAGKALERGLAVFMEKPIAGDALRAAALARQAAGKTTAVDFQFIETASFQALKSAIDRSQLGKIQQVEIEWRSLSYAYRMKKWSWKTDGAQAGGVLTMSGTHVFYLLEWLFGPVTLLEAKLSNRGAMDFAPAGLLAAEDDAILTLKTSAGAPIQAHLSNASAESPLHRWTVTGERGVAILENSEPNTFAGLRFSASAAGRPVGETVRETIGPDEDRVAPCSRLARRFVDAARGGRSMEPNFAAGARVQQFVDAARRFTA